MNTSTLIWYGDWSNAGFEFIAEKHLRGQMDSIVLEKPKQVISEMIQMYHDVVNEAEEYYQQSDHIVYISP